MAARTIRALIVDDEPIARQILREELSRMDGIVIAGEAGNGREAVEMIESFRPGLVMLDIQMPVMDGFQVIQKLKCPVPPAVVFVTAFDQHALRAFEAGAADYLLKPVSEERLRIAIGKARHFADRHAGMAEKLADTVNAAQPDTVKKVVGRKGHDYYLLDLDQVQFFRVEGEMVWIQTANQRYLATQTLRVLEQKLQGSPFRRIHRNTLVNTDHIRKMSALSSQRWLVTLNNQQELVVSKRLVNSIRSLLSV